MVNESLMNNINHLKRTIREIYIFTNQLNIIKNLEAMSKTQINEKEKKLLIEIIISLSNQLVILNNSIPILIDKINFYKKLKSSETVKTTEENKLVSVSYKSSKDQEDLVLTIDEKDKKEFLENLSKSKLSINLLKKDFSVQNPISSFAKSNVYAKISNKYFRNISTKLVEKNYFKTLNLNLRKMNSSFVLSTYVSIMLFTTILVFFLSLIFFILSLFFEISLIYPFFSLTSETLIVKLIKNIGVIFILPFLTFLILYYYPFAESKTIGSKINQELPFVTIHMASIASSGIEPVKLFNIIIKNEEYKYTNVEIKKLINLVNFHGDDIVTALKKMSKSTPSTKLGDLFDGMATTLTSGGNLNQFLDKHSDTLLFDYKLEREKSTKVAETYMDIYISLVIAAPMILLMLFVIMGSTGSLSNFLGLSTNVLSFLIILIIALLNIAFLVFLRLQQPKM
jgi:flagellar protein FlaJ